MTLMEPFLFVTQRPLVVGAMRNGNYSTLYREAQMSRWVNLTGGSEDGSARIENERHQVSVHPKYQKIFGHTQSLGFVWRSFETFYQKNQNVLLYLSFVFRLCSSWLETCLKWSFLMDKKSSFPTVRAWTSSATSKSQETSNWLPSKSAKRQLLSHMHAVFVSLVKDKTLRISHCETCSSLRDGDLQHIGNVSSFKMSCCAQEYKMFKFKWSCFVVFEAL